jgi:broad specificity phosphatase PhoE
MSHLILIRHSVPELDAGAPASQWRLSEIGRQRCIALARALAPYSPARLYTSREPKAVETGEIASQLLGIPCETAEGLHEHDRSGVGFLPGEQFAPAIERFFLNPDSLVFGNETADAAHARFSTRVIELMSAHVGGNTAIVSHGTVITLLVSRATGAEPVTFWKRLGAPSFIVLSYPDLQLEKVVEWVSE